MEIKKTTLDELRQNIALLASVEESDAPFISCYLNLENGLTSWQETFNNRIHILRRILKGCDRTDFEEALGKIETYLMSELLPESKGVAIFSRGLSGGSFFLPMQFAAPLPNWIVVNPTPNIYHLMELKDNYHRYIILLVHEDRARILEVNLGAVTTQFWLNHSELQLRVGSEWSRSHYQIHQMDRGEHFLHEKILVLEQLMNSGGHSHLILAGDPDITERICHALPNTLSEKLVDMIPTNKYDQQKDVVMATLSNFIKYEEQESQTIAEKLIDGLRSQNLAVAGSRECLNALKEGDVDILVMASNYHPEPGWICTDCNASGTEAPETPVCTECGLSTVRPLDVKEELLRLAGQRERPVEVVEHSDALMSVGGVGCLLRIIKVVSNNS
ncbi:MAG: hypothetical protein OQL19_00755 [Gammaproteobacteria bacterium]|nr:hypothetical protein [Gammaproteobacteria bacterium]